MKGRERKKKFDGKGRSPHFLNVNVSYSAVRPATKFTELTGEAVATDSVGCLPCADIRGKGQRETCAESEGLPSSLLLKLLLVQTNPYPSELPGESSDLLDATHPFRCTWYQS